MTTTTDVHVDISYDDKISVEIYDLNANRIVTLVRRSLHSKGSYTFPLNYSLASGTYLVVLKGTGTLATSKFIKQ